MVTKISPPPRIVSKVIDHTWTGDNANNRIIDLGDDYDLIIIWLEGSGSPNTNHPTFASAFREVYNTIFEQSTNRAVSASGAGANAYFQGKMSGADKNKIKLGTSGSTPDGLNDGGRVYRLLGLKFHNVV